ncbi:MAG: hypothetical protein OXI11_11115 [Gammaproteobacteria bacterium]|nr:hypothetical protein [Gammaproteobacteria bacterium]
MMEFVDQAVELLTRLLRREHCRIVQPDGRSRPLPEIYPQAA